MVWGCTCAIFARPSFSVGSGNETTWKPKYSVNTCTPKDTTFFLLNTHYLHVWKFLVMLFQLYNYTSDESGRVETAMYILAMQNTTSMQVLELEKRHWDPQDFNLGLLNSIRSSEWPSTITGETTLKLIFKLTNETHSLYGCIQRGLGMRLGLLTNIQLNSLPDCKPHL